MKGKILILSCLFLLVTIQASVLTVFFEGRTIPNIFLILVVFFASRRGLDRGLMVAIFSGLMMDIFSFWPIGTNILILAIAAYIAGSVSKRFLVNEGTASYFLIAAIMVGAILMQEIVLSVIAETSMRFLSGGIVWPTSWHLVLKIMIKIIWSLVMLAFLYPVFRKIDRLFFGPARNIYLARQ